MSAGTDTVHGRIARFDPSKAQLVGLALALAIAGAIMFAQTPALHDGMHDFRHAAGITCH